MDPDAMAPYGLALIAYEGGEPDAELVIRREDGLETRLPVGHFFREPDEFSALERAALERCRGHVLDIGAGTGLHSLALESRGLRVTAVELDPRAVQIMRRHGLEDVRCLDIFHLRDGCFDTLLMLGHGIGIVEDLEGLDRFLAHAYRLVRADGQLLLNSLDLRRTEDPVHLNYHEALRGAGRYIGEIRVQLEYRGQVGPYCGWLHVDPEVLRERARTAGWKSEVVREEETGDYLARLTLDETDAT